MATIIMRHKVSDFTAWKTTFDSMQELRRGAGERSAKVVQVDGDPNDVVLVFEYDSLEAARRFLGSAEVAAGMKSAGVTSEPEIVYGTAV